MLTVIVGLDLSLRSAGMVALPLDWSQSWERVAVGAAGSSLTKDASEVERVERLMGIEEAVLAFVKAHGCTHAVLEQYAFSAMASQAHALGELGGVVKCALVEAGLSLAVVAPSRARTLLGKAPRKGAKVWAAQRLVAAGAPPRWSLDQLDAFCVANHLASELGGAAVILRDHPELFAMGGGA